MNNSNNTQNEVQNLPKYTEPIVAQDGKYTLEVYERDSNRFGGEHLLCKLYVYPSDWDRASIALRNLTREYNKRTTRPFIIRGNRRRAVESVKKIER